MSSVIVVTPLIIAGWPVITAAVTAAIGSMGFSLAAASHASVKSAIKDQQSQKARAEIDVEDSEILADAGPANGELVIERDDIRIVFTRDPRGALKLCVEGEKHSKAELKRIGEEVLGRVTQQFVYHRIVSELGARNMTIVDEHVAADQTVKIRVRNL
ncbi:MAG TPA: hypothetical protein VF624_18050 [Tepidisphaeraceae bacterium]|jgi:hypothetical protein